MRMRAAMVLSLVILPGAVRAQQCPSSTQVGHLGITSLECDCIIAPPTRSTQWRFFTEPIVVRVEPRGPAAGRIQEGDVITSVNGYAVTTETGATLLARPPRDRDVVVRVRRNGRMQQVTLRTTTLCPGDARALGATPPAGRQQASVTVNARTTSSTPAPQPQTATSRVVPPTSWIGIAFSCDDCAYETRAGAPVWNFRTSPEVYSVEPGSPAYNAGIRRGDVLTHVDDHALTTAEGGRRWASLSPGDLVRLRYRRGNVTRPATIRVSPPRNTAQNPPQSAATREWMELQATMAARDSVTQRMMQQFEQSMRTQQTTQERLVRQMRDRGLADPADRRLYTQLQETLQRQEQQLQELMRLRQTESARDAAVKRELEQLLAASKMNAAAAATPVSGTQRYSGTFSGVDLEVRGGNPVIVSEGGNELVIRMADGSTVTLRRNR